MLRNLFKETTIYALGPQVPKIASFFILPIITKDLTSYDYGIAALVSSYIGILAALKALGLTDVFINYFYKRPKYYKVIWSHLLGFLSLYSLVFACIQGLLLFIIMPLDAESKLIVIALNVIPIVLFENVNVFGSRYLQLHHKPLPVATIAAISGLVTVFSNLFTISYLKLGYLGWFISTLIGASIQFIFYSFSLYKNDIVPLFLIRFKYLKSYLRIGIPFVPNKYGHYLLNSSDRIVMDLMNVSTSNLGLYNFGYNIGNYFQILVNSLGIAIAPLYLKLISSKDTTQYKRAKDITNYLQALLVVVTFIISIWLKEIFGILVSNEQLSTTYNIAIIIVMTQNYAPLRFYFTNFIVYNERTFFLWKITFVAGVINVGLNVLLIPYFGVMVAAITTFITMFYISIVGFYHPRYLEIKNIELKPLFWFFLVSVLTFLVYLLRDVNIPIKVCLSLILIGSAVLIHLKKKSLLSQE